MLALRWFVLIAAIAQAVVPFVVNPFSDGHAQIQAREPSQIEPAGYAFSIWAVIYLAALGYSIWQLVPAGRADPVTARIALPALILYVGSSAWLVAATYGPLWATMPILAVMAACAIAALGLATRSGDAPDAACWRRWAVIVPFGVYAGWTACATFVNIAEVAPGLGWDRFGMSTVAYGVVSIAAAGAISALVLWWTRGELAFLATVVWALIAIIVAARLRGHAPAIVVAAAFTIVAVVIVAITVSAERLRIRRPG